ncbi:MAG: hypothetical protein RIQ93_1885 [Verrucomicrobiota bacterium]|jgi:hypothetical protein
MNASSRPHRGLAPSRCLSPIFNGGLGSNDFSPMKIRSLLLFLSVVGAVFFSGCSSANLVRVKPWERATLADYTMRPDRDPLHNALAEHVYYSRETATGGRGVGGSGCGCN